MLENTAYAGSEWIERQYFCNEMSVLGKEVADLLGDMYYGIYHLNFSSLRKVDWNAKYCIRFVLNKGMSTFDFDELTRLVVLSHDRMIRVEVNPRAFKYLELQFSFRKYRKSDCSYENMPTMEQHVESIRNRYYVKPLSDDYIRKD